MKQHVFCPQMELQAASLVFNANIVLHQAGQVLRVCLDLLVVSCLPALPGHPARCVRVYVRHSPSSLKTGRFVQLAWSIMNFPKVRVVALICASSNAQLHVGGVSPERRIAA